MYVLIAPRHCGLGDDKAWDHWLAMLVGCIPKIAGVGLLDNRMLRNSLQLMRSFMPMNTGPPSSYWYHSIFPASSNRATSHSSAPQPPLPSAVMHA